jgi:hypothetical protein
MSIWKLTLGYGSFGKGSRKKKTTKLEGISYAHIVNLYHSPLLYIMYFSFIIGLKQMQASNLASAISFTFQGSSY